MLAHSFNRFCVVSKFILLMIGDLKFSKLDCDDTCAHTENKYAHKTDSKKYMLELKPFAIKSNHL